MTSILENMTKEEQKKYFAYKYEYRKTNEFFVQNAELRVNNVLKALRILAQLSRYNYTSEQIDNILSAVDDAVQNMKEKFESKKRKEIFQLK